MPTLLPTVNPLAALDPPQLAALPSDSHDEPGRHRRFLDRSPLVASVDLCGAMARLIG
jgi:hypothetical protein